MNQTNNIDFNKEKNQMIRILSDILHKRGNREEKERLGRLPMIDTKKNTSRYNGMYFRYALQGHKVYLTITAEGN